MRNIKTYISAVAVTAMLFTAESCQKSFYTNANINHNSPNTVTPATLLTGIQVSLGYSRGGDFSRFSSVLIQQMTGVSNQFAAYQNYVFTNQDPESAWDNMYDDVMANDYQLMLQASKKGDREYYGMGQILMAYSLQQMVDCWGDIPYSQAFLGAANLQPKFDNAAALYDTAVALCYKGMKNVNNTANDVDVPGADDIMYAGTSANWTKFANAILARLYIHQSYVRSTSTNVTAMADSALAHANLSFASFGDDAQIVFGSAATNNAPWYQFNTQRANIEFAYVDYTSPDYSIFMDSLLIEQDPRINYLMDSTNEPNTGDGLGAYYDGPGSSSPLTGVVELATYSEMQFVSAEAVLRGAVGGVAQAYYTSGITAHMTKLGVASGLITTFTTTGAWAVLSPVPATAILQNAWQENISLYSSPEAWTLWRRCEWPITPTTANAGGKVPHRFLYPQSEINLNPNAMPLAGSATQQTPAIFWDK